MTGEAKKSTDTWIKEKGAKYAYAYDGGGKFARIMGVSRIPHAVLVDASGTILVSGSASEVTEELLKKALAGALKKPLWELPKSMSKVRSALAKADLSGALKDAEALAAQKDPLPDAASIAASVRAMIAGALATAEEMEHAEDFLGAQRGYERLQKSAKGLPEEATCKGRLATIQADGKAQKGIKAQKQLEKILEDPVKSKKDAEEQKRLLSDFAKKHEGTFAAKRAAELASAN